MHAKHAFVKWVGLPTALALSLGVSAAPALAAPHGQDAVSTMTASIDQEFRAAYPLDAPSSSLRLAGVALDRLRLPGLQLSSRSDDAGDDGGVLLSFSDRSGAVRALVQIAVLPDVMWARRVLGTELRAVSLPLSRAFDPLLGDLAYADDGGRGTSLVLATQANVAYRVQIVESGSDVPSAASIAGLVRTAMIAGSPTYPQVTLSLPATIDAKSGAVLRIQVPGGLPYTLRAEGGYVARGQSGPLIRPFAAGPITVFATVTSELGCVTIASASSLAR